MIKRENWNNRYVWVARDEGKIKSWMYTKGSQLNKQKAEVKFKEDKTFIKGQKHELFVSTNFKEKAIISSTSIGRRSQKPITRKPFKTAMYQVRGNYKGITIISNSKKIKRGVRGFPQSSREAKKEAWNGFLRRVAEANNLNYDEDEGLSLIDDVSNLQEGWVYYVPK